MTKGFATFSTISEGRTIEALGKAAVSHKCKVENTMRNIQRIYPLLLRLIFLAFFISTMRLKLIHAQWNSPHGSKLTLKEAVNLARS